MSKIRVQEKDTVMRLTQSTYLPVSSSPLIYSVLRDTIRSKNGPGSGYCEHFTMALFWVYSYYYYRGILHANWYVNYNCNRDIIYWRDTCRDFAQEYWLSLNRDKLPTSTQTSILNILFEIDDTIAMFSKQFLSKLSFGAVNWGILPFISDIKACAQAVKTALKGLENVYNYEDSYDQTFEKLWYEDSVHRVWIKGTGKFHIAGSVHLAAANDLAKALDQLALHIDAAALWDAIPFSFVVDYVFPVAKVLDSYRGWVATIPYQGWASLTLKDLEIDHEIKDTHIDGGGTFNTTVYPKYYRREFVRTELTIIPDKPFKVLEAKLPSFVQMLNVLYLLLTGASGKDFEPFRFLK